MPPSPQYTLPIGKVVNTSFSIYFRNLALLLALAGLILGPWIVVRIWFETDPRSTTLALVALVLQIGLGQVLTGAVTYGVVQHMSGARPGLQQVLAVGVRSFFPALITGWIWALLVFGGLILFVVPGILAAVWFYPAVPACVIERLGVRGALTRAEALTKGARWQILGALALMLLIVVAAFGIPGAIVAMLRGASDEPPAWFDIPMTLLLAPLLSIFPAVVYSMLREGKENVDAKQLAAVFA